MNDEMLQEIRCPNCQSQIKLTGTGQSITCDACNSQFVLAGHLCPKCQTYHRNEIAFCGRCGTPMSRLCGRCQTNNWAGDEFCYHCGQAMDLIDLARLRHKAERDNQQERRRLEIARMKQQEEESSRKRMAELMEMERLRLEDLHRRLEKERAKQRTMLAVTATMVVLFLVLIALYALFNAAG